MTGLFNRCAIILLKGYHLFISPLFPPVCRFQPTCSTYAMQAFQKYPFFKAMWLTTYRILRCNPFNRGGYDPLP